MRVLQLFNQPSRSYTDGGEAQLDSVDAAEAAKGDGVAPKSPAEMEAERRAERRSRYYSAASDPRLRREWDRILQEDQRTRSRRPASAGVAVSTKPSRPVFASVNEQDGLHVPKPPKGAAKDDNDSDEFYTPYASPQASPQTAALDLANHSPILQSLTVAATSDMNQEPRHSRLGSSSSSTVSQSYASSVVSSEDNYTNYSWSAGTGSEHTHITISSSRSSRHSKQLSDPTHNNMAPPADWAKDIRWLVAPEHSSAAPKRTISAPPSSSAASTRSRSSSRSSGSLGSRSKTEPIRPRGKRRMSEIQEEVEDDDGRLSLDEGAARAPQLSDFGVPPQRRKSQSSQSRGYGRKKSLSTHSETSSTSSIRTVDLPPLVPHAEPGTYTSLVFPRASYQPSKHPERLSSSVDMIHIGVGSTTMTTISVTKHAAEMLNRGRKFSLPSIISPRNSSETPSHLLEESTVPIVALTSHTPTPSKVQNHQVLVQVCCVALEGIDVVITREKSKTAEGYGFVPGRGFYGRIIEAGLGVSNVRKGDWVVGCLDLSKSGALSEFLIADKRRIHRAPPATPSLTAEHLAVLAVSGLFAQRATSTLPTPCKGQRVLILQAHDGAGALAAQELVAAGARVTAQIADVKQLDKLRGLTLDSVKVGEPLAVLQSFEPSEEGSFDAVLDTVGGKEIWEACKRVFGSTGQFTTFVGDSADAALSRNAHVKSNMRSLKLAWKRQENRSIGYEWVSPSAEVDHEGRDIQASLAATCNLATEGYVRPRISPHLIVPFERAPDLLNGYRRDGLAAELLSGAVGVVRLQ